MLSNLFMLAQVFQDTFDHVVDAFVSVGTKFSQATAGLHLRVCAKSVIIASLV